MTTRFNQSGEDEDAANSGAMRVREQRQVSANKRQLCSGAAAIADDPHPGLADSISRQGQQNIFSLRTEERDGRRGRRRKYCGLQLQREPWAWVYHAQSPVFRRERKWWAATAHRHLHTLRRVRKNKGTIGCVLLVKLAVVRVEFECNDRRPGRCGPLG